ncbi:hypothetical protein PVAP13_2NG462903 [Panicum virgatum]|uniref:Uncharacterized protein n=1 Tax=Panicum virgatum TaxID=38727 RepID=A0A8T0VV91_PANVG|nr:hypothetical protein PVAP13_2NG462903 [Panicum virgatum]
MRLPTSSTFSSCGRAPSSPFGQRCSLPTSPSSSPPPSPPQPLPRCRPHAIPLHCTHGTYAPRPALRPAFRAKPAQWHGRPIVPWSAHHAWPARLGGRQRHSRSPISRRPEGGGGARWPAVRDRAGRRRRRPTRGWCSARGCAGAGAGGGGGDGRGGHPARARGGRRRRGPRRAAPLWPARGMGVGVRAEEREGGWGLGVGRKKRV